MTPHSLQNLSSSLEVLPVAMIFSKQLLLTQQPSSSVPAKSDSSDGNPAALTLRATRMTAILKSIPGYSHEGLNE
jgi:hypothetical protein